jgi:putative oxidoreductase
MSIALLVLRLVVGLLFIGHGLQKLRDVVVSLRAKENRGAAAFFEQIGLAPGLPLVMVAMVAEVGGGFLLASGLVTPLATALIAGVMTMAVLAVHWRKGIWNANGGIEFPLVLLTAAFVVTALGPGSYSLGSWAGINEWTGISWTASNVAKAGAAVGAGAVAALGTYTLLRLRGLLAHHGLPAGA